MLTRAIATLSVVVATLTCGVLTATASAAPVMRVVTPTAMSAAQVTATINPKSNANQCLDIYDAGAGPWVQSWSCNGWANQQWFLVWYDDAQNWEVRSSDNWCVDGSGGRGALLQHSQCTGVIGQRFTIWHDDSTGGYTFQSVQFPGQVWDVYDFGRGTQVQLWDWGHDGRSNQEWTTSLL
jgi:hypothetical protein